MLAKLRDKYKHETKTENKVSGHNEHHDHDQKESDKTKKKKNRKKPPKHDYFKGHECCIPIGKQTKYDLGQKRRTLWSVILYLTSIRSEDIRSRHMYRSYAALSAEKYRQYKHFPCSIHPHSRLRLLIDAFSILILQSSSIFLTIYFVMPLQYNVFDGLDYMCEFLYFINVIANFFTGYIKGHSSKFVVLEHKKIAWKYIRTWLILDLIFCSGLLTWFARHRTEMWVVIESCVKVLLLPRLFQYTDNILQVFDASDVTKTLVDITLMVTNYLLWNMIFQFSLEFLVEQTRTPSNQRNCSWLALSRMWNATDFERKISAFNRAVGMLQQNSNPLLLEQDGCFEVFFVFAWRLGKLLVIHCSLRCMLVMFGLESAKAGFFMMTQQVQMYMDQRRFPARIKTKVLRFYAARFQWHFFEERRMMQCVSGRLREDIIMHSSRQLVGEVLFLKNLPRSLILQIGVKLKVVIFLAGDIIFKINTVGDCLYFIDKGTVAIYSESGQEVCHLQDGEFFGEQALVMQPRFRMTSAVAVENCELFRLDKEDFDRTIAIFPTVYEDIKKIAFQRLERTILLDEHHKAELRIGDENQEEENAM